jgi:hypothetical protein
MHTRDQNVKCHFLETGFSSQTDFGVVRHSATNSGLLSNNRFRFHGNGVKVVRT